MNRLATRSPGELEDDEASRLVRKAPKKKPPRHDRRREHMSEGDPDVDSDPDLKNKDTSLNFKTIGGSVVDRVVARYAGRANDRIPAKSKETGKRVIINEETLQEHPELYEKWKPKKKGPSKKKVKPAEPQDQEPATPSVEQAIENAGKPEGAQPPEGQAPPDKPKPPRPNGPRKPIAPKVPPGGAAPSSEAEQPEQAPEEPSAETAEAPEASPEASPEAEPPEASEGEKPGKKKKKKKKTKSKKTKEKSEDKSKDKPAEAPAPEPKTVADKLGIKPPKRREVSAAERQETALMLADNFPPELAAKLIVGNYHPDDARELVDTYRAAQARPIGNPASFAEKAAKIYQTDPDKIPPPKTWPNDFKAQIPFEVLSPEQQSEVYRKHQMQVLAMSFAAERQLQNKLSFGNKVPSDVTKTVTRAMLTGMNEDTASKVADHIFDMHANEKDYEKISPSSALHMLNAVEGNRGASHIMRSYLDANIYKHAKDLYLHRDGFSEHDDPSEIAKGLRSARDFFKTQGLYAGDAKQSSEGAKRFETRTLAKLRNLDENKYHEVRKQLATQDAHDYDKAQSKYEKQHQKWEKNPTKTAEPKPPPKPLNYSHAKTDEQLQKEGQQLWEDLHDRSGQTKTAAQVTSKFLISSYLVGIPMHRTSDQRTKQALYHGVDPRAQYPEPYPRSTQIHTRDLSEVDHDRIVARARELMGSGDPDQKFRDALDHALEDALGPSPAKLDTTTYNSLLARLEGVKEPGLHQVGLPTKHAVDRQTLEKAVFHRFPSDSRMTSGGLQVMLTGSVASEMRKADFTTIKLSGLSEEELLKLARAVEVPVHTRNSSFAHAKDAVPRKPENGVKQMLRLSNEQVTAANQILESFDQLAQSIQNNHRKWGMTFVAAKKLVNHIDRTADAAETLFFGQDSLNVRQAEMVLQDVDARQSLLDEGLLSRSQLAKAARVFQRDPDESYMDTFKNPQAPIETDSDEPYMSAYRDDQSSAVEVGEDDTGRELAPEM